MPCQFSITGFRIIKNVIYNVSKELSPNFVTNIAWNLLTSISPETAIITIFHQFSDDFKGNSLIKDTIDPATTITKNENILKLAYLPPTKVYTFTKLVKCCM